MTCVVQTPCEVSPLGKEIDGGRLVCESCYVGGLQHGHVEGIDWLDDSKNERVLRNSEKYYGGA